MINVISWNMGYNIKDYYEQLLYSDPSKAAGIPIVHEEGEKEWEWTIKDQKTIKEYQAAQKAANSALLGMKPDAFLLQETGRLETRPFIKDLAAAKGYQVITCEGESGRLDSAIALSTARFSAIANHSQRLLAGEENRQVAIATAKDKVTGKTVAFVSAHLPGFNFLKDVDEKGIVQPPSDAPGKELCKQIAQKLNSIGPAQIRIIGADMNATPENAPQRFAELAKKGFTLYRTGKTTNAHTREGKKLQERELDYFFVAQEPRKLSPLEIVMEKISKAVRSIWNFIKLHLFGTPLKEMNSAQVLFSFKSQPPFSSDHLPIKINFTN